ncbi:MAG: response regulator [Candidatus Diapherotrites archaeon]|nr:response regulator [Candidatus Diapherotrites archaeon]
MKTILVVDDEPDVRDTVKTVLEKHGFKVVTAVDGDDALHRLKGVTPDLILLDIMMPGLPVRDLVSQVKGVKIAYLTVVRTTEAEKEQLFTNSNVVGFIQKPFDIGELIAQVNHLMGD